MGGCVLPDVTIKLKWMNAWIQGEREVTQDVRNDFGRSENRGLEGSCQYIRLFQYNHLKGCSRAYSTRERSRIEQADGTHKQLRSGKGCSLPYITRQRRQTAPVDIAHNHSINESALKEAVASLINRIYQGTAVDSYFYVDILQECFKQKDIESVKQVHDCIKRSQLEQNLYVANNLLKCYIGCGNLESAQKLFNKILNKNIVSWTIMIGGYAEHEQAEDAIELYKQLCNEGWQPNAVTYLTVLKACTSPVALKWGTHIHAHILRDGFQVDIRVCNALVHMYAKCGSVEDARAVFDKMEGRNVISWNAMIGGLAQHGYGHEAFSLFQQMQREGFAPNSITCRCILSARADPNDLAWVKEVHSHATKSGLAHDLYVNNALILMYAKCGSVDDAKLVFNNMVNRDAISWNAMIGGLARHGRGHEAFSCFHRMQSEGVLPDAATYLSILDPNACEGALTWVKEVHGYAARSGLDADLRVASALVHMYGKSGSIEDARLVFERMEKRDVVCWNVMIGGLAQHGLGHEAFSLFLGMQKEGITPNKATYLSILNPCSSMGAIEWVKEVHAHATKVGFDVDLCIGNALVHMYAKSGSIKDARAVFDNLEERDVISWNVMIGGLAEHGLGREAFSLFLQMQRNGLTPNSFTFVNILNPCSSTGALEWVKEVHAHAMKAGLDVYPRVGNALVHMYAKIGNIGGARQVFDKLLDRDVVSWTVMIGGLAQHGHGREALHFFEEMKSKGVKPDGPLFLAVLLACCHVGLVDEGRLQFVSMTLDYELESALEHYACMVDILGRAGHLDEAKLFILNMPIPPDEVTWMSLLGACRIYSSIELAEFAAKECLKLEPTDPSPYVLLSNIYAAAGSWNQVSLIRNMMQDRSIRKEPGLCWIEVDNKVHHFVGGDTSHPEARDIYAMRNSLFKKLKAEGYNPDTRLVLMDLDEEDKENAVESHSEKLAISYGLIHMSPGTPIRIYKNLRICTDCHTATKLISKITGREIMARDANRFHHFKEGVCSCGDYW